MIPDARSSGEPHYFVADVLLRNGRTDVEPRCAACRKPPAHPWHIREPRTITSSMRRFRRAGQR